MGTAATLTMSSRRVSSPVVSQSIATASPGGGSSNRKRKPGSRNRHWSTRRLIESSIRTSPD
jgi:hypothetical protein